MSEKEQKYDAAKRVMEKRKAVLADLMDCICTDKPNVECWQYQHHLEHAGEPGSFPKTAFDS